MAIRQLPIVGGPTNPPAPLRKIALEEHVLDPSLHLYYGDSFSAQFAQDGYGGFTPEYANAVDARLRDLRDGRIEEMDAAGIDISILSHTLGGTEGITDPALAVSTAPRINDFLAAEIAASSGRFAGFASVALQDVDAAVKELTRAVTELGFCGVMINGYSDLGADKLYLDEDSPAHRRRRPHHVRQRLPLRHGHRRSPVDREGPDRRERPPQDLLRQRRGTLWPP
jgi:hypothetical protein